MKLEKRKNADLKRKKDWLKKEDWKRKRKRKNCVLLVKKKKLKEKSRKKPKQLKSILKILVLQTLWKLKKSMTETYLKNLLTFLNLTLKNSLRKLKPTKMRQIHLNQLMKKQFHRINQNLWKSKLIMKLKIIQKSLEIPNL